jgi:hypothetical protein
VPKFVCPRCRRDVAAEADLEGNAANCARCGKYVESWPAPIRRTRKPGGGIRLATCSEISLGIITLCAVIVALWILFGRN